MTVSKPYLTPPKFCREFGFPLNRLRAMIATGAVPGFRSGRYFYIDVAAFRDRLSEFGVYNPIKDLIDNEKAFYVGNKNIKRLTEYYNKWYGTPETTIYMDQVDEIDGYKIWAVKTAEN